MPNESPFLQITKMVLGDGGIEAADLPEAEGAG
jgi:hypothetical protein